MTKREISERLLDIYDFLQMWGTGLSQDDPFEYAHSANSEEFFDEAKKVRSLILDLSEEEP